MAYKLTRQDVWVTFAALVVIVLAALVTALLSGVLSVGESGGQSKSYKNITATEAVLACQDQTRREFGRGLTQQVVDDHSTRFDHKMGKHKVFLQARTGSTVDNSDLNYYVSCFVSSRSGKVVEYDAYADKEVKSKAIRRDDTNMFGMPKKS